VGKSGKLRKETLLFLAKILLLAIGWISALYSYPRLPERITLWLNFLRQEVLTTNKSTALFISSGSNALCRGFLAPVEN